MATKVKRRRGARVVLWIVVVVLVILLALVGFFLWNFFSGSSGEGSPIVLENPLKSLIQANMNADGSVNRSDLIEQAVAEFNADYINYLLVVLGANNLHKSYIGYGNPKIEFVVGDEFWNSELDGGLTTGRGESDDPDLRISISKEEAVEALLSEDVEDFMKDSVASGRTGVEMVAGKIELGSKGYLEMYNELTGSEFEDSEGGTGEELEG
jgi:hypothetical protein